VLIDEGLSGTTMDRPGLRTLRDLVNTQAIAAMIVYDPDRLSRNLGHQLLLAEEFERAGVTLLIVSHPLQQGAEGWLFFQMRGALAEYERAKILERTRRGTVGRIQAGHPWGGCAPLGYRSVSEPHGGRFEIDEEEAALVRRIYAMCLGGMSLRAIARQLTAEGLPTPLERRTVDRTWRRFPPGTWQPTTIRDLLTSEAYTGRAAWGKRQNLPHSKRRRRTPESEWIPLAIPPIIDAAIFQAAKTALAHLLAPADDDGVAVEYRHHLRLPASRRVTPRWRSRTLTELRLRCRYRRKKGFRGRRTGARLDAVAVFGRDHCVVIGKMHVSITIDPMINFGLSYPEYQQRQYGESNWLESYHSQCMWTCGAHLLTPYLLPPPDWGWNYIGKERASQYDRQRRATAAVQTVPNDTLPRDVSWSSAAGR
jgi:DNA invertase Pin-like site-specific DNA recombinase